MGGNFVCCGDFNIDLLDFESYKCKLFNNFLKDLGLLQIIRDATRVTRTSRTLVDLILTSEDSSACAAGVQSVGISDHELIHCTLSCPERSRNLSFTFRDFKNMPLDDFYADLCSSPLHQIFYTRNIDEKIEILNEILLGLLDVYAPVTIVHKHSRKHYAPWLTSNTRYLMGLRDKAFKDFKKTSSKIEILNEILLGLLDVYAPVTIVHKHSRKHYAPWLTSNTRYLMGLRDKAFKDFKKTSSSAKWL
ncbi:hypothetical protein QE152_g26583 [Popillia japonica]|uniref:Endonuclease/exonuclease/phosphatase domain-containing protein n=1 Tax=Popillia japonica TaxID=7064 RepID=A0AAW1JXU1_POPJA